jgi:hypothetical protein
MILETIIYALRRGHEISHVHVGSRGYFGMEKYVSRFETMDREAVRHSEISHKVAHETRYHPFSYGSFSLMHSKVLIIILNRSLSFTSILLNGRPMQKQSMLRRDSLHEPSSHFMHWTLSRTPFAETKQPT